MAVVTQCPFCHKDISADAQACPYCRKAIPRHVLCAVCHKPLDAREAKNWKERYGGAVLHEACFNILFESVKCPKCSTPYFQPEREHVHDKVRHECPKCRTQLHISHCGGCGQSLVEEAQGVMNAPAPTAGDKYSHGSKFHTVCFGRYEAEHKRAEEEKRNRIMGERKSRGECMMCGESLGMLDKLTGKHQHKNCNEYRR